MTLRRACRVLQLGHQAAHALVGSQQPVRRRRQAATSQVGVEALRIRTQRLDVVHYASSLAVAASGFGSTSRALTIEIS